MDRKAFKILCAEVNVLQQQGHWTEARQILDILNRDVLARSQAFRLGK